jgi:hypothetical protein
MAVINPPDALPGAAFVITKYLQRTNAPVAADELASLLSPMRPQEPGARLGNIHRTLSVMENLGMIGDRDVVGLTDDFAARIDEPVTRPRFDSALRRLIVDPRRNGDDPWDDFNSSAGGRDIARALTWFLAQPAVGSPLIFGGPGEHDADARQLNDLQALGPNTRAVPNQEQWNSFRRWAPALGLATPCRVLIGGRLTDALEPVPAPAIAAELADVKPGQRPLPEVLRELRTVMPYLPGGATAAQLEARIGTPIDPDERDGFLASSLAESLLLLEARGTISLRALADAEGVQVRDGETTRPLTHITIRKASA